MMDKYEKALLEGRALILPTETVYGLFARALDKKAVEQVYALKKRPKDKAMNLNVANFEDILTYSSNQPPFLRQLYEAFLPGPLTIILQANNRVPAWINSGLKTVGFRVPKHAKTLELIRKTGPLIGPSANISGQESGKSFSSIQQQFDQSLMGIKDDQAITGLDSTILDLSSDKAGILRQGAISKDDILKIIPGLPF